MNQVFDSGLRTIHGGMELLAPDESVAAVMGLLAFRDRDERVVGLTVCFAAPIHATPKVVAGKTTFDLEAAEGVGVTGRTHVHASEFITQIPIPETLDVSPIVAAVGAINPPAADPADLAGSTLLVSCGGWLHKCRLQAYDATFYVELEADGPLVTVGGAIELVPIDRSVTFDGAAGAIIVTPDRRPVGIVIASEGRAIFGAPLLSLFASGGLRALTDFDAAIHNIGSRRPPDGATRGRRDVALEAPPKMTAVNRDLRELAVAYLGAARLVDVGAVGKVAELRARLREPLEPTSVEVFRRREIADWIRKGVGRWLRAANRRSRSEAFTPLVLNRHGEPHPEIVAVLASLAPGLAADAVRGVVEMIREGRTPLSDDDKIGLWRFVRDYLADRKEIRRDLATEVRHAINTMLRRDPKDCDMEVAQAAIDAALMLPSSKGKQTIFEQLAAWDTTNAPMIAAKYLLRSEAEGAVSFDPTNILVLTVRRSSVWGNLLSQLAHLRGVSGYDRMTVAELEAALNVAKPAGDASPPTGGRPWDAEDAARLARLKANVAALEQV